MAQQNMLCVGIEWVVCSAQETVRFEPVLFFRCIDNLHGIDSVFVSHNLEDSAGTALAASSLVLLTLGYSALR